MGIFVYADGLFPKRLTQTYTKFDSYIKEHVGIDAAIIAFNLSVTERFVMLRQRKLGLRTLTHSSDHRKPRRVK